MVKKTGRIIIGMAIVLCFVAVNGVAAEDNQNVQVNGKELKGKVIEAIEPTLRTGISLGDDFWGVTTWVVEPGIFVKGPVFDDKGKVIREGDVLVKSDTQFYDHQFEAAKGTALAAKGVLKDAEIHYKRCQELVTTKVVSERERDEAEADLFRAQGEFQKVLAELKHAQYMVNLCIIRAPFDGFVEQVFTVPGSMNNFDLPSYDSVVSLRKLSPVYVDVEMDRNLARKIKNQEVGISVYSLTAGKAVGAYNSRILLTDNGIRIPVLNHVIHDSSLAEKEMSVVNDLLCLTKFYKAGDAGSPLCAPESCLYKDDKGLYVWHAVNQKLMQPGKVIDKEFIVKKVYVKSGNKIREGYGQRMQMLDDTGGLLEFDAVLNTAPKGLKDNEKVAYRTVRCLFWPGDEVKVVVN